MYDIIILATTKNVPVLNISLPYIRKNLKWDRIYIVANRRDFERLQCLQVELIDENAVYQGLNFDNIATIINEIAGERKRAGWYLQQFIKMAWSYKTDRPYYVVFDADTVPLDKIEYFNSSGQYLLSQKKEYHRPYFDTLSRLFSGEIEKISIGSFIAENMIIDAEIMREMISQIECNSNLRGNTFYEKILFAINKTDLLGSGFSEFETYGNYIYSKYPDKVELRTLKACREAMQIIGSHPSNDTLTWAAKDYEIISIEASNYRDTFLTRLTGNSLFRSLFKMRTIVRVRTFLRSKYRKIIGRDDIVFD